MLYRSCGGVVLSTYSNFILSCVLLYGSSKRGNPLTVRGENPLNPLSVKNVPEVFRIKSFVFQTSSWEHHFQSPQSCGYTIEVTLVSIQKLYRITRVYTGVVSIQKLYYSCV
jgi:hypothetical protein